MILGSKVASTVDGLGNIHDNNKISGHVEGISLHMHEHWFCVLENMSHGNKNILSHGLHFLSYDLCSRDHRISVCVYGD